ncbi:MAG TPA: 16S rRNA (cytidine(1402)-2'-O)-methyltransferase [Bacteroidales bacterium]|nr:16S rRNA (cytidine(1402)-2'-O)-methyltransferase [Bacteroidales bacterium]
MSRLFIVPTPIGNLKDITLRALDILKDVDIILAEDTRKTRILLDHYQIKTRLRSHHKFNEHGAVTGVVNEINEGKSAALVTDAGTPGISDPGYLLVRACLEKEIEVETLPGATAFIPALINSGIPCDRFCFEGFIPQKKGRQKKINSIAREERTIVLYESPHRLIKTLTQLAEKLGNERKASVSRELTKIHEENVRGSLADIVSHFKDRTIKGEIVIIIEGEK